MSQTFLSRVQAGAEAELGLLPLQFMIFKKSTAAKHSSETITLLFAPGEDLEQLLL